MTKDEALQMCLEYIETDAHERRHVRWAIKKALEAPVQPKVRTGDCLLVGVCASEGHKIQAQRQWVGLTDEEKNAITWGKTVYEILELAEAKLKEKNT